MAVMQDFTGKRVLVTGAGTGIGNGIARAFAERGAAVVFHYSHPGQHAGQSAADVVASGGKAAAFQADFNTVEEVKRLAAESLKFLGGIDVLVNNAGITMNLPIAKVTPEQFDTVYHVNVRAPLFLCQALIPAMIEQKSGVIVNISSIHALAGYQDHSVYAGTRGAIVAFTRELAIELCTKGIRVNGIAPGSIEVEAYYSSAPEFDPKAAGRQIPAGFIGQPRDIAEVACFLASDAARYILGQTLVVDGGTTSWMSFGDGFKHPTTASFGKGYVAGV